MEIECLNEKRAQEIYKLVHSLKPIGNLKINQLKQ